VRTADHAGTSKTAEQHLRDQIHELDSVKMNVSAAERPYLDRIVARAGVLREEILYSLMHPSSGPKNKASAESAQGDVSPK
jgi:hypothetical protein